MTVYNVGHMWTNTEGQPYLRILPGELDNVDIAFYIADAITEATQTESGVYVLNADTLQLDQVERPESTTPPEDMPNIRIAPGNNPEGAPDVLAGIEEGGGGIGGGIGGGGEQEGEPQPEPTP